MIKNQINLPGFIKFIEIKKSGEELTVYENKNISKKEKKKKKVFYNKNKH